jgi:hypothetical protein
LIVGSAGALINVASSRYVGGAGRSANNAARVYPGDSDSSTNHRDNSTNQKWTRA